MISFSKRLLLSVVRILCGVPIVSLLGLGALFVVFSVTWKGRCVGLSAALVASLLFLSAGYWNRQWFKKCRKRLFGVLFPLIVALALPAVILAPDGGNKNERVRNRYLGGTNRFHRYSPWNIIPEIDQVSMGLNLLPLGDPYVDFAKGRRIRSLVLPAYQRMDEDPEFRQLGSAMGSTAKDLLHLGSCDGHYYLFLPDTAPDERVPCLIFLHGMGGNIKPCFWMLSRIAMRMKCAVAAPTFGLGLWQNEGSAEFVVDVTREAIKTLPIDAERVFLMGYSQGAVGVTRAAVRQPGLYRGLIYLSPITEDDLLGTPEFASQKENLRLLFLHGSDDLRIPCSFVEGTAKILERTGYHVWIRIFDGEDHYLILSQQEALLDDLAQFMAEEFPSAATDSTMGEPTR